MMNFLTMIYKRKKSKKKEINPEDMDEEVLESDSSDDIDLESGSEEGSEMGWSLEIAPEGLREEIFHKVCHRDNLH
jgi:hypothetical protein